MWEGRHEQALKEEFEAEKVELISTHGRARKEMLEVQAAMESANAEAAAEARQVRLYRPPVQYCENACAPLLVASLWQIWTPLRFDVETWLHAPAGGWYGLVPDCLSPSA